MLMQPRPMAETSMVPRRRRLMGRTSSFDGSQGRRRSPDQVRSGPGARAASPAAGLTYGPPCGSMSTNTVLVASCAKSRLEPRQETPPSRGTRAPAPREGSRQVKRRIERSAEHTSELQSRQYLVCRLLLEKKKQTNL